MSEPNEEPLSPLEPPSPGASDLDTQSGERSPANGFGAVAFICGLLGFGFAWTLVVPSVLAPLAVVLGCVGISRGRRSGAGVGLASAGLVLGLVCVALVAALAWAYHGMGR